MSASAVSENKLPSTSAANSTAAVPKPVEMKPVEIKQTDRKTIDTRTADSKAGDRAAANSAAAPAAASAVPGLRNGGMPMGEIPVSAKGWRDFFLAWPNDLARRGVLVTTYDDQIPFLGFMASETMLLLERTTPDTVGARKVLISYHVINALKFTDVLKARPFQLMGFQGALPKT